MEFGPESKLKEAKERLDRVYDLLHNCEKNFKNSLKGVLFDGKVLSMITYLDGSSFFGFGVEATRNKCGKLEIKYIQKN